MNPSSIHANESAAHGSSGPLPLKQLQRYGLAILPVGVALGASLLLEHFHFRVPSALLLLLAVAISSWFGGPGSAVMAVVLSTISFYWYFVEPVRTIYIYWSQVPYFVIFAAFAALLSWFGTVRRRIEKDLRERADLLNLTHDTIFVMDMAGVIKYWNRGAAERYGWSAEQAVGRVVHDLLKTVLPAPLEQIKAEVTRTGRWEGELVHAKKDGTQVAVASRWSLQHDKKGVPVTILETNNDITERKRAEEALHRLNRELRAIGNCNQVLLRATDEQSLLEEICRIVCEETGYRTAWVGYAEHDEAKSVRPVAWAGVEEGYLTNLGITWADTEHGWSPTGTAIRSGKTCCIQDFATDPRLAPWRESVLRHSFLSGIAVPLKDEHGNAFGSLSIYSAQPNAFTSEEIRLLEELAGDLAFGIVTLRSRAARERAEQEAALLSFALDKGHEAAFLIDDTARFHYVNEEACRALGYTRAELLGMGVPDIDPEFPAERWSDHWRNQKTQRSLRFESRHRTRDGRIFPVEISANYLEYGGRAYHWALVRDITERKRTEEELRRSEGYLAETQRLTHTGTWVGDPTTTPLYWSDELFRIFGFDPQHGLPTRDQPLQRIHPEDLDKFWQAFQRVIHEKVDSDVEYRIVLPDGTVKHVYGIGHPVLNANGELVELVGTTVDITERKRAEEALRQSEAYLAEAQRLSHTGSWAFDLASDKYVYASEECLRIFELDVQEGLPTREMVSRLIRPEDWDRVNGDFEKSLREKVDTSSEFTIALPSGTTKHILAIRHPVLNSAGDVVRIVGTVIDITERKRAEEEVRNTAAQWQATFDAVQDLVLLLDKDFRILRANRAAAEFLGLPFDKIVGGHCFNLIHGTSTPPAECPLAKMRRSRRHEEVEVLAREGGPWLWVSVAPVFDPSGELTLVVHVARDITERKRAEETLRSSEVERRRAETALQETRTELERVSRVTTMGALTASIAHEVNQPLAGVVTSANAGLNWLGHNPPNLSKTREALVRVLRDGTRAGEVLARIRGLLKRTPSAKTLVSANQIVREVLALTAGELRGDNIETVLALEPSLPAVLGDTIQLQQVLLNLITNAIEAMAEVAKGQRTLRIQSSLGELDGKPAVVVAVSDTGLGLGNADVARLFEAFHTTKPQGMGMGLWISRSIVEAHGGRLTAQANSGQGATFVLTIPTEQELAK